MAKFHYIIEDKDGKKLEGIVEAVSEQKAHHFLTERHYEVIALKPYRQPFSIEKWSERFAKVNLAGFNFFVRQLATLLRAGVPMLTTLTTLQDGIKDPLLRQTVQEVYQDIEKGSSFSEAIARHPRVFSYFFVATVRSGEAIGELDTVLLRLAEMLEKDYMLTAKIKAALRYPVMAFSVMALAFLAMTLFIIPRFKVLFEGFGAELPLPTRILMGTSEAVTQYWYVVLLVMAAVSVGIYRHYQTRKGRLFWDDLMIRSWIIGPFMTNAIFSRFTRMLGMMLKSGVNILQGLELIAEIVGNAVMRETILRIRERVSQGSSMADQMSQEKIFSPVVVQIVRVGEESGKMDDLLLQIASYYDSELETMSKNMESMIEPIFIVMLAALVLLMALGIFLPMWNMNTIIMNSGSNH
ncbi:MAG: type II secretion system F family protein [Candidatus Omnitrophica bacterium]|nr:type II secretion system F family protein [Candidatus Omnitrophota bacterium]